MRRRDPIGRGATRQQHEDKIAAVHRVRHRKHPLSCGDARLIRYRVSGLDHRDMPGRTAIAVPSDAETGKPLARQDNGIMRFRDFDH